jgi:hypothetical protein
MLTPNLSNIRSLLKTGYDLENIGETSNDVFYDNAIDTYLNRPDDLLNIKYRDFYSNYVRDFKNCDKNEFKFRKLTKRIITRVNFYKKNCEEEKEAYYSQIILCNICLTKLHFDGNNKYILPRLPTDMLVYTSHPNKGNIFMDFVFKFI